MLYPIVRCFDVQNKRFGTKTIVSILFRKNKQKKTFRQENKRFDLILQNKHLNAKKERFGKNLNYLICRSEPLGLIDFCFVAAKKVEKKKLKFFF
jgi:hypothetical protein